MNKPTKKTSTKKASKKNNKSWWRRIWWLLFKLFLIFVAVTVVYGIYLDQQIKERIDGNVWELPAAVYGQIVDLEPDSDYSLSDVVTLLKVHNTVSKIVKQHVPVNLLSKTMLLKSIDDHLLFLMVKNKLFELE